MSRAARAAQCRERPCGTGQGPASSPSRALLPARRGRSGTVAATSSMLPPESTVRRPFGDHPPSSRPNGGGAGRRRRPPGPSKSPWAPLPCAPPAAPPPLPQCPRKASESHHDPPSDAIGACTSKGALRGPVTQSATPRRSAGARTVTASNPYPRPTAARSISGKGRGVVRLRGSGAPRRRSRGRCRRPRPWGPQPDHGLQLGEPPSARRRRRARRRPAGRAGRAPHRPPSPTQPDRLEGLREAEPGSSGTDR